MYNNDRYLFTFFENGGVVLELSAYSFIYFTTLFSFFVKSDDVPDFFTNYLYSKERSYESVCSRYASHDDSSSENRAVHLYDDIIEDDVTDREVYAGLVSRLSHDCDCYNATWHSFPSSVVRR